MRRLAPCCERSLPTSTMISLLQSAAARALAILCAVLLTVSGCTGPQAPHPAVGSVDLRNLADRSRPSPQFVDRVTLLNFWGTWCPPCRRELPGLVRIAGRLQSDPRFQLVAVSCGGGGRDDLEELARSTRTFLEGTRLALDAWADPDGLTRMVFSEAYGFEAYPTTYLIGPDGRVERVWSGYRSRDEADIAAAVILLLRQIPLPDQRSGPAAR